MSPASSHVLTPPTREDGKRLREFLQQAGYDLDTLRGGLGFTDLASFRFRKYLLTRDPNPSLLDVIVQWFTCGLEVSRAEANRVVPAWALDLFQATGLLSADGEILRPVAMLSPFRDLLIASDLITKLDGDASDLIVWPNATTYQIMNAAVPRSHGSVLDLGCGSGVLAVAEARSNTVTAIDLNSRSAEFCAFNAALNDVGPIECLIGDCFAPVAGRRFDLILCNPPFFLVPSTGLMYCENSMELDLFARRLMREAPKYLNDSGFFEMLCEWVELAGEPWRDRLAEWAEGVECDVWILKTYTMTPNEYGKQRCEQRPGGQAAGDAAFGSWVDYYREKNINAVHGGLVMLRRRAGKNWVRIDENPTVTLASPVGEMILAGFAAQDLIELSDQELVAKRLRLIDRSRLRQLLKRQGTKWTQSGLSLTGSFERELEMAPLVAEFVGKFDGTRAFGDLIGDLAQQTGADPQLVAKECLEITRKLLERGFLSEAVE